MSEHAEFIRRSEEMMDLYTAGKYAEALTLTEQLALKYPAEDANTSLWRICLFSRMGKTAEALTAMSEALQRGMWWSEPQLRLDEDLAPLQGVPAYETMVAESQKRRLEAQQDAKPGLLVRLPAGAPPHPLVIVLHGRGGRAETELHHWEPILEMGWMLAMPQSSQPVSPVAFGWDDTNRAEAEIRGHYERLLEEQPVDAKKVIVGGFSQGAGLAIRMCMQQDVPARGFLAVAPGASAMQGLDQLFPAAVGIRGYLVVGGRDRRYETFAKTRDLLTGKGIACGMEEHPETGHEFPGDFARSLSQGLGFLLA